jgi:hypothetical protein
MLTFLLETPIAVPMSAHRGLGRAVYHSTRPLFKRCPSFMLFTEDHLDAPNVLRQTRNEV